ncbi:MAG: hypothetical protein Q9217_001808 [Psora testacea]
MPSPPRPPRGSPPRRALHEKSDAHTNERVPPTLRMVGEPSAPIHETNPYPTKPSQILKPSGQYPPRDLTLNAKPYEQLPLGASHVGQRESAGLPSAENEGRNTRQDSDAKGLGERSPTDVSFSTTSPIDSTMIRTPSVGRNRTSLVLNPSHGLIRRVSHDDTQCMGHATAIKVPDAQPRAADSMQVVERQPANKDSDSSLSSTNSTGTVIVKRIRDDKKRASYPAFPYTGRPTSSRSDFYTSASQNTVPPDPAEKVAKESPMSPSIPVSATFSASSESQIAPASRAVTPNYVQYPIIKPPSASGSWAKSTVTAPQQPPRVLERAQDRWNPHLSTVQSEGTSSSASGERTSQNMWLPDSSRASKSSSNFLNPRMSSDVPSVPGKSSSEYATSPPTKTILNALPSQSPDLPTPPEVHRRDFTGSTIRVVNERGNGTLRLPPTIPGSRDSELITSNEFEGRRSVVITRSGSRASFFRDSIPAWAKIYYARPASSNSIPKNDTFHRTSTSADDTFLNGFRPSNRAPKPNPIFDRRVSGLNMHPPRPQELNLVEICGSSRRRISPSWSPHLWHDRTSLGRRRSLFMAPAVNEQAEDHSLTKRNVQIVMFALGYIFPLAWFIAAVLPLPPGPAIPTNKGKTPLRHTQMVQDLEKQLGPIDLARYENARWWRNINRIMCFVGAAVVVAILLRKSFTGDMLPYIDVPFHYLSSATGASVDELKLITSFLLSYPLAGVLKRIPDAKPWQKNAFIIGVSFFYLVGLFDLWSGIRTIFISSAGAYLIASYVEGPFMPWIGFVFLMGHMSVNHLYRQFVNDPRRVDITGAQMVLVMKLTAFCWNVQDGRLPQEDLADFQRERALPRLPNLLDYAGYVLFFPSLFAGPSFDYVDYQRWIETSMFEVPARTARSQYPNVRKQRKIPSSSTPATIKAIIGLMWIFLFLNFSSWYNTNLVLGDQYMKYSFLRRVGILEMLGFSTRMKYYGVWHLTEGACILSGMGYKGINPKTGKIEWNRLQNVNPWGIESAQNSRAYLENWNMNTNHWLRNYMYLRVTPKGKKPGFRASLATFVTSAFWHGFYPGYYLTFVLAAFLQTIAKNFRRHVRPFFLTPDGQRPTAYKPYYDIISYLATQTAFCFTTAPFVLLTLPASLLVWSRVYFYTILGAVASMAFFASPAKAWLIKRLRARNEGATPAQKKGRAIENEREHPLMGLPSDPVGDIEEAVKEIKDEVENRRKNGSRVSMPTGVEMQKAVEEKMGKRIS